MAVWLGLAAALLAAPAPSLLPADYEPLLELRGLASSGKHYDEMLWDVVVGKRPDGSRFLWAKLHGGEISEDWRDGPGDDWVDSPYVRLIDGDGREIARLNIHEGRLGAGAEQYGPREAICDLAALPETFSVAVGYAGYLDLSHPPGGAHEMLLAPPPPEPGDVVDAALERCGRERAAVMQRVTVSHRADPEAAAALLDLLDRSVEPVLRAQVAEPFAEGWQEGVYAGSPTFRLSPEGRPGRAMQISGTTADRGCVQQVVTGLQEGGRYRLSALYRTSGLKRTRDDSGLRIRVMFQREDGSSANEERHVYLVGDPEVREWTKVGGSFVVPATTQRTTVELFLWYAEGTVWWDDVVLSPEGTEAQTQEPVNLLANPGFDRARQDLLGAFSRGTSEWRFRETAQTCAGLAFVYACPRSRWHGDPDVLAATVKAVEFLRRGMSPVGRWYEKDANVDRFTLAPMAETVLLVAHAVPRETLAAWLGMLRRAGEYQLETYFARSTGTYPNMDAYFILSVALVGHILGEPAMLEAAATRVDQMRQCLDEGGGFEYILGFNPVVVYQDITVQCLYRYCLLTGAAAARQLVADTREYYPCFIEPLGTTDSGMEPAWKHYWGHAGAVMAPEAVASAARDGRNKGAARVVLAKTLHTARERVERGAAVSSTWMHQFPHALQWLSDVPAEPLPQDFLRPLPSIRGFQARRGDWCTAYLTGRSSARDTYVSLVTSKAGPGPAFDTCLMGVALENQTADGLIHGLSDSPPRITQVADDAVAVQRVDSGLHAIGPALDWPFTQKRWMDQWTWSPYPRGRPEPGPWRASQTWVLTRDLLAGMVWAEAAEAADGQFVRLTAGFYPPGVQVKSLVGDQFLVGERLLVRVHDPRGWSARAEGSFLRVTDAAPGMQRWEPGMTRTVGLVLAAVPPGNQPDLMSLSRKARYWGIGDWGQALWVRTWWDGEEADYLAVSSQWGAPKDVETAVAGSYAAAEPLGDSPALRVTKGQGEQTVLRGSLQPLSLGVWRLRAGGY